MKAFSHRHQAQLAAVPAQPGPDHSGKGGKGVGGVVTVPVQPGPDQGDRGGEGDGGVVAVPATEPQVITNPEFQASQDIPAAQVPASTPTSSICNASNRSPTPGTAKSVLSSTSPSIILYLLNNKV